VPLFAIPPAPPQPPAIVQCEAPRCAKFLYLHRGRSIDARFIGDVRIDLQSEDVLAVPAGASVTIEERTGKPSRRLTIAEGKTVYTVNGVEKPFDTTARQWLRQVLSTMPERPTPPAKPSR
jgi:hypothetical protein